MKTKVIIGLVLLLIVGCAGMKPLTQQELDTAYFGPYPMDYQQRIQAHFSTILLDPYSAMYHFQEPFKARDGKGYGWKVVVEVNAKNRMGGYTGRERYYFMFRDYEMYQSDVLLTGFINGGR